MEHPGFMTKLKALYVQYKSPILYLFFGGCTTLINIGVYELLYQAIHVFNAISTAAAWLAAVIFAFITNKLFVFESRHTSAKESVREAISFFGCRAATGILDLVIMVLAVDLLHWNSLLWKIISNVLVILINYVASKWLIFKKK